MADYSPPFRDSDAIRIIIRRLEVIEDLMRSHTYDSVPERMAEVGDWFEWLAASIAERQEK